MQWGFHHGLLAHEALQLLIYSQAAGVPANLVTGLGLCAFSDGTGQLAGFEARVDVTCPAGPDCDWDGTYSFNRGRD